MIVYNTHRARRGRREEASWLRLAPATAPNFTQPGRKQVEVSMETRLLRIPGRPLPRFSIPTAEGAGLGNGPLPARRPLAAVHRPSCSEGSGRLKSAACAFKWAGPLSLWRKLIDGMSFFPSPPAARK